MRWLSIIGIGENGLAGLGETATRLIAEAELVVGGARHLRLVERLRPRRQATWKSPIEASIDDILALRGKPVVVLASGDPFHFGIGSTLIARISSEEIQSLPQPSSFSLAAAHLGWALQEVPCLSIHGRPLEAVIPHLHAGRRLLVLAWDGSSARALADLLRNRGFAPSLIHIMQALGGPRESVVSVRAETFDGSATDPLTVIALDLRAEDGARAVQLSAGLDDEWFEHDGQLTRREIRAVTLGALQPEPGQLLWDIGGGAGSIAIEWMLRHPSLRALAIERRPDRAARIARNAAHLGTPSLEILIGEAPQILDGLAAPDAVFIGGGTSNPAVMQAAWTALKSGGRLVANAVTVEGEEQLMKGAARHGGDVVRLGVERLAPIGRFHAFRAAMPVTQWSVTKSRRTMP